MSEHKQEITGQKDANLDSETRPIPSQAEGDLETVEQDLQQKEDAAASGSAKGRTAGDKL